MNVAIAMEYIPRRMKELGYGSDYYIRFRHLVLEPDEKREINAYNQFYMLIEEPSEIKISSDFGFFDLKEENTNEQDYEHQGRIIIYNYGRNYTGVRFIQVIPKHRPIKNNN